MEKKMIESLRNVEIAKYVVEELEKKGYSVDYSKILNDIDISRDEKEENGKISKTDAEQLKQNFLVGYEERYDLKNREENIN